MVTGTLLYSHWGIAKSIHHISTAVEVCTLFSASPHLQREVNGSMKLLLSSRAAAGTCVFLWLLTGCGGNNTQSNNQPEGQPQSPSTKGLEAGAKALQDLTPVKQFDIYLVGFHPMKDDPNHHMEAHHYC